jgi:PAS domain S-box-containing protein
MSKDTHTPPQAWIVLLSLSAVTLMTFSVLLLLGIVKVQPGGVLGNADETFVLYALTAFNFVAFSVFAFILARNLIRLKRERRARKLGSFLKTKLVRYFIVISILPLVFLAMFSYLFINRTVEKWFGDPYRNIVDESKRFADEYNKDELNDLRTAARVIRQLAEAEVLSGPSASLDELLSAQMQNPKLVAIELLTDPNGPPITRSRSDSDALTVATDALTQARLSVLANQAFDQPLVGRQGQVFLIVGLPFETTRGGITAVYQMPQDFIRLAARLDQQREAYERLYRKQGQTRRVTLQVLGVITVLLLFAATWTAMYLAKGITEPIQALAAATAQVARGDFSKPVESLAEDELAMLVNSFNKMIAELGESRRRVEESSRELHEINVTLEDRRRYIETVIESLSTGIVSLDREGSLTTINRAAMRILRMEEMPLEKAQVAALFAPLLGETNYATVAKLIRRSLRTGYAAGELELQTGTETKHLIVAASPLRDISGAAQGAVVIFEDVSDLVNAQQQSVWGEVARRMAHEIKNPLTPIKLSAERMAKQLSGLQGPITDDRFKKIVAEGATTIITEVRTLQRMVDEFARFARLPAARLLEGSMNDIITATVKLYDDRSGTLRIETDLDDDLPPVRLDAEQIKRALVNLIDNAIEAMDGSGPEQRVTIQTRALSDRETILLTVSDTGHGITPQDRARLFTPYFSKKERGTGLGLAIVSRIVAEHNGRVRVEDNHPRGTRFIIELPASEMKPAAMQDAGYAMRDT